MSSLDPLFKSPYNPFGNKAVERQSMASRPGLVPLCEERLKRFHPALWQIPVWKRQDYLHVKKLRQLIEEQLRYGLAEAAVVLEVEPLLVIACYSEELDGVVHVCFGDSLPPHLPRYWYPPDLRSELISRHNLRPGSRLLSVHTFHFIEQDFARDILVGPISRRVYGNFRPIIADFLTNNYPRVEDRKRHIGAHEWQRCHELARDYKTHVADGIILPRDGRPVFSDLEVEQNWLAGHEPEQVLKG